MDFKLEEGMKKLIESKVTEEHTASKFASGTVDVFATPAMIALMENTAKTCVDSHLPEGFTTVGTEVNIKHMKATPVGMIVKCEAELIKADGKKLLFKVEAWDEKGKIGEGTHGRYIINIEDFMKRISD